jgi:hypothetical protein
MYGTGDVTHFTIYTTPKMCKFYYGTHLGKGGGGVGDNYFFSLSLSLLRIAI